jgi:hypothetical protein
MTLITIRRRTPRRPTAAHSSNRPMWAAALMTVLAGASAVGAQLVWLRVGGGLPPAVALGALLVPGPLAIVPIVSLGAPIALFLALRFARVTDARFWVPVWTLGAPWLLDRASPTPTGEAPRVAGNPPARAALLDRVDAVATSRPDHLAHERWQTDQSPSRPTVAPRRPRHPPCTPGSTRRPGAGRRRIRGSFRTTVLNRELFVTGQNRHSGGV